MVACGSSGLLLDLVVPDEALGLEHLGDRHLHLGGGDGDGVVAGADSVADAGEHVRDRVTHRHWFVASVACRAVYQLDLVTPGR